MTPSPSPLQVGDPAPAITVLDMHGQPVALTDWSDGPTLVTFLRHFG